jgi:hypothetical protein
LENNSRNPTGLVENWHGDDLKKAQLTLSHGKKKEGNEVEDDYDDDVVRTSVSQDRVTAALCTEELFLCTQYIRSNIRGVGYGWSTRHIWRAVGCHTSQLDIIAVSRASDKNGSFCKIIL